MSKPVLCVISMMLVVSGFAGEPEPPPSFYTANGGKAWSEVAKGKVGKVFAAEYVGGKFLAYQVKWGESDVIVHDGALEKTKVLKEGDDIAFLVQTTEHLVDGKPHRGLSFTMMPTIPFREVRRDKEGHAEPGVGADSRLRPAVW